MNKKLTTIAALAGITVTTIHIINKVQYSVSTVKNTLSSPNNKYYEWRFGKIRYTQKGTGTPLLLIHDLTVGSSSYEFSRLVNILSEKHEVYSIDLLGYGLSDKPNITYTNYLYVQSVIDFIKNVIGKKASIITSGDSAAISIMAAHNDGEIIDKIFLINPQSLNQMNQIPTRQTKLLKFLIDTPIIGTFVYNMFTTKEAFRKALQSDCFNQEIIHEDIVEAYNESAHTPDYNSKYSYASYAGRFMNANIIHALKQIDHSIYILYGKGKKENASIVENYLSHNSSIEAFGIENTKQLPHLEDPYSLYNHMDILL